MDLLNQKSLSKILVVDDDQNVVQALKRIIQFISPQSYVRIAIGGSDGMKALATEHFDLIISDLRMPVIDGTQMLTSARRNQPDTVRILLSGQGTIEKLLEALPVSHQYLEKPCPAKQLTKIIDLIEVLKDTTLPSIVLKHILSFTAFPCDAHILHILHAALDDDSFDVTDKIARIIPSDLGLYLATLRLEAVARGMTPGLIASLADSSFIAPIEHDEYLMRQHRVLTIKFHLLRKLLIKEEKLLTQDALKIAAFALSGELVLLMQVTHSPELIRELAPYTKEISILLAKLWGIDAQIISYLNSQKLEDLRSQTDNLFPPEQASLTSSDDLISMLGEVLCSIDCFHDFH